MTLFSPLADGRAIPVYYGYPPPPGFSLCATVGALYNETGEGVLPDAKTCEMCDIWAGGQPFDHRLFSYVFSSLASFVHEGSGLTLPQPVSRNRWRICVVLS